MTRNTADRYLRRGGPVPQIYPGNLRNGLAQAIADAQRASKFLPGVSCTVEAVYGKNRFMVRIYQDGELTWAPETGAVRE